MTFSMQGRKSHESGQAAAGWWGIEGIEPGVSPADRALLRARRRGTRRGLAGVAACLRSGDAHALHSRRALDVFDSRYPQLGCRGEVKFPLGRWKQGEVREYQLDCARGKRPLKVTIEEIDFVHDGVPHSLRFHWLFMDGRGRGTDMRYVYSPLRGLVEVQVNE
jgi:hypothetical protein